MQSSRYESTIFSNTMHHEHQMPLNIVPGHAPDTSSRITSSLPSCGADDATADSAREAPKAPPPPHPPNHLLPLRGGGGPPNPGRIRVWHVLHLRLSRGTARDRTDLRDTLCPPWDSAMLPGYIFTCCDLLQLCGETKLTVHSQCQASPDRWATARLLANIADIYRSTNNAYNYTEPQEHWFEAVIQRHKSYAHAL